MITKSPDKNFKKFYEIIKEAPDEILEIPLGLIIVIFREGLQKQTQV